MVSYNTPVLAYNDYINTANTPINKSIYGSNTTSQTIGSNINNTVSEFDLGADLGGNYGNMYISEFIIYNTILTSTQRQQVEGYLAWKWNLQASLPTTHPFYYNPLLQNLVLQNQILNPTIITSQISFNPLNVSGLVLWLDGADKSKMSFDTSSTISQIIDKSVNAYVFNPMSGSGNPQWLSNFNGTYPCLNSISGANILSNARTVSATTVQGATGLSYVIVGKYVSGYGLVEFENTGVGGTRIVDIEANTNNIRVDYNSTSYLPSISFIVPFMCFISYNSSTSNLQIYYNGNLVSNVNNVASASISYSSGYGFFGQNSGTTGSFATQGQIAEYVGYSLPLASNQRQQVEGYLAWKWNLQSNLPTNHSYYLFPPN